GDRRANAGRREPRAVGPSRRRGAAPRRRHAGAAARARRRRARRRRRADGEVLYPASAPFKTTGALYALYGNLAPEGSLVKASGAARRTQRGPARVFDSEESCTDAVRSGLVREGDVLVVR